MPKKRAPWRSLVPVVVGALLIAAGVGFTIWLKTPDEPQGPAVAIPVRVPDQVDCDAMISLDEISDVVTAEFNVADLHRDVEQHTDGIRQLCRWSSTGLNPGQEPFAIYVERGSWLPPDGYTPGTSEEFMVEGNAAYQTDRADICHAAVAVGQDIELSVGVFDLDERCEVARSLLETAFSHLSG
jgi:hypothetical protein